MSDKNNLDHGTDHSDGHAAVPESAQFIEESTLIPPSSSYGLDGESVQVIGESSVETAPEGTAAAPAAPTKAGSSASKNIPIIGAGLVGLALIGAFGFKMLSGEPEAAQRAPEKVMAQAVTPVAKVPPVTSVAPTVPVAQVAPIASAAQATSVASAIAYVAHVASAAPIAQAASVAPVVPAVSVGFQPPIAKDPIAATAVVPTAANPEVVRALTDQVNSVNGRTSANRTDIVDLQDRVTKLEGGKAASGSVASGSSKSATTKPMTAAQRATAEQRRANTAAEKVRSAEAKAEMQKREAMITKNAGFYHLHALKDNLVWLSTKDGEVYTFAIGDKVPGVGTLTNVNEIGRNVIVSGRVIR